MKNPQISSIKKLHEMLTTRKPGTRTVRYLQCFPLFNFSSFLWLLKFKLKAQENPLSTVDEDKYMRRYI